MREILDDLRQWWELGSRFAVATVVDTFGSAPRLPGASMGVGPAGEAVGSVSGGCVEGAVYDHCLEAIASGETSLHRFGVSDEDAFAVGLTCGGILDVLVQPVDRTLFPEFGALADAVAAGRPAGVTVLVSHPDTARVGSRLLLLEAGVTGTLGDPRLDTTVAREASALLELGATRSHEYGAGGQRLAQEIRAFSQSFVPPPRLIVFGAIDFAASMAEIGSFLGYHVTVCDARPVFATRSRFPRADEVVVDWPHRYLSGEVERGAIDDRTAVCVLTHDPKFDIPLLEVALRLPEGAYVGAMGSRRTHEDRMRRLRELGLDERELTRLASPIGLDLGARTPEETAVSIAAELVAFRRGGCGVPLSKTSGPIHDVDERAVAAG